MGIEFGVRGLWLLAVPGLVCGCLDAVDRTGRSVYAIGEQPLPAGVCQLRLNDRLGMTVHSILRCLARQDADVVAVDVPCDEDAIYLCLELAMSRLVFMRDPGGALDVDPYLRQHLVVGVVTQVADGQARPPHHAPPDLALDVLLRRVDEAPVVRLTNHIVATAIADGASAIHIEHERVRYRIDGLLRDVASPPSDLLVPVVARLKIMANMDVVETRIPQDGLIRLRHEGSDHRVRVSTCADKAVLRFTPPPQPPPALNRLGLSEAMLSSIESILAQPNGLFVVAGTAGSGKSTTLYSCLKRFNTCDLNIMTVEDPCEWMIPGVNQVQDWRFAPILRSFEGQDPDVVMVTELRDTETAQCAMRLARRCRVISEVPMEGSAHAIGWLLDLGIEPGELVGVLRAVLYQRMVRTQSGGLTGVFELLILSESIRRHIGNGTEEIRQAAIDDGMLTLSDDGLRKVEDGIITREEYLLYIARWDRKGSKPPAW